MVAVAVDWVKLAAVTLPENPTSEALVIVRPAIGFGVVEAAPTLPVNVTFPLPATMVSEFVRAGCRSSSSRVFWKSTLPPPDVRVIKAPAAGLRRTGWTKVTG